MSPVVAIRGVSLELTNGRELFKNLTFSLGANLTAMVGPNGIGKSCLARILAGELKPTEGTVSCNGAITYFPQRQTPEPISVDEFLAFDYTWADCKEKLLDGIDRQALCTDLSGGEWMRVRLSRALAGHFLILDEPTNDLDRKSRDILARFLRQHDCGALLISHDRECLSLCDEVLELSNRGLAKFGGGWDAYVESKERERDALTNALEHAKRERDSALLSRNELRARQEKRNRHGARTAARGGMPKILLGARKNSAETVSGKLNTATLGRLNNAVRNVHESLSDLKVDPVMFADLVGLKIPAQKLIAEATGFNVRFQDWIYRADLSFSWRGNVRVALKGTNGSGKSTLLKAIMGSKLETRGILRHGNLATLYIDQQCSVLNDERTVIENIRDACDLGEVEIRNGLARFLFAGEMVFQTVKNLSGGERLRAALARGFLSTTKPELLILDEPTNSLDLINVEFLEKVVRSFSAAIIVVSHDDVFLKNCEIDQELFLG